MRDTGAVQSFCEAFMSNDMPVPEMSMFKDVMTGALYIDIDPNSCLPFINTRKVNRTGVLCSITISSGRSATNIRLAAAELPCGSNTAVVVRLKEKSHHLIYEDSKAEGDREAEAQQSSRCRKIWYGIVDGR